MNKVLFFVLIFLFTTTLGLYVGQKMIPEVGNTNPVTGTSVDDPFSAVYFLVVIISVTAIFLLVLKYYKGDLLFRIFEVYVIFVGSLIVWQFFIFDILDSAPFIISQNQYLAAVFLVSALTVAIRLLKRNPLTENLTLSLAIAGAGGYLGSFMGFFPALLLLLALGTYDIIAVFKTKHMVKLADESRLRRMPVMFQTSSKGIKTEKRKGGRGRDVLGLGTGDISVPLIFFVGILRSFESLPLVIGAIIGAMAGLALTIYYVTNVRRVALPALPPIISFSVFGFAISYIILGLPI